MTAEPRNTRYPYWPDLSDDEGDAVSAWFDDTCGDCADNTCHGGHPDHCGCARHNASVLSRKYEHPTLVASVTVEAAYQHARREAARVARGGAR